MWLWGLAVSAGLVFLFAAVSLVPVYIDLRITKNNRDDEVLIAMRTVWGLVYHEFRIPIISVHKANPYDATITLKSEQRESKGQRKINQRRSLSLRNLINPRSKHKKPFFHKSKIRSRKEFIRYLIRHTQLEHFHWTTKIGTKDPALTGMLVGALWAAKGVVISKVNSLLSVPADYSVNITPVYGSKLLHTDFTCILRTSLSHIIVASLKLAWNLRFFRTKGAQQ